MSHGLPSGYVRLYDAEGNPVMVRLDDTGQHTLAVSDKSAERLLGAVQKQTDVLERMLLHLASISGSPIS